MSFCRKAPSLALPPEEIYGGGDSGGEAASLREAPLPQTPAPEEQLAFKVRLSSSLVPPVSWARLRYAWLWSRRLTEPPRPADTRGAGDAEGLKNMQKIL